MFRLFAFVVFLLIGSQKWAAAEPPVILVAPEEHPYNYVEDGHITGMFVEIVREAFRRAGHAVEIRLLPWPRCMEEVRFGRADGMYVVYKTPEREQIFDFTGQPLEFLHEHFFVRNASALGLEIDKEFTALRGKRVGILAFTKHSDKVTRAMEKGALGKVVAVNSYETLARMLESGRLDAVLAVRDPMVTALHAVGAADLVRQVEPDVDVIPAFLVLTKMRDLSGLRADYDRALTAMKADGSYDKLIAAYTPR